MVFNSLFPSSTFIVRVLIAICMCTTAVLIITCRNDHLVIKVLSSLIIALRNWSWYYSLSHASGLFPQLSELCALCREGGDMDFPVSMVMNHT